MSEEAAHSKLHLEEQVKSLGNVCRHFRPPQPKAGSVPPKERKHGDVLKALTINLINTYSHCSDEFRYSLNAAPRRVLTKLSKGVHNGGYDNAEHDYICRVGDSIVNPDGQAYEIAERLGHGSFGQVLKCTQANRSTPIALKIIKNKPAYFHQALVEVRILQMLNMEFDPEDENRMVRMLDFFVYRKHLCIAFELLSVNLYDVLKQNNFRGVSMALIRVLTEQLLKALKCLRLANVIHCDLKPENVLLYDMQHTKIKLIDFGSACFENHTVYSYIQSRFYRSPEVLVGLPYTSAIDMWSLGCICAELFLGLPIYPGHSEYDQVCRLVEVLGLPPAFMLDQGKNTKRYFRRVELEPESGGSNSSGGGSEEATAGEGKDVTPEKENGRTATSTEQQSTGDASESGSNAEVKPSESIFDLLKRKLNIGEYAEETPPAAPAKAGSERSTDSTRADTTDSTARGRVPSSGEEPPSQDPPVSDGRTGSDDGRGSLHSSTSKKTLVRPRTRKRKTRTVWRLKTKEEFERGENKKEPTPKKYYDYKSLRDMVELVPYKANLSRRALKDEHGRRLCFLQFLTGLFQMDPGERWTPKQAADHAFVTGHPYDPDFRPPRDEPVRPPAEASLQHGLWSHLCAEIPLPSDHPAESYRPPIDKMSDDFFKNASSRMNRGAGSGSEQPKVSARGAPGGSGRSSGVGVSVQSTASSTGSTPTGGRALRASPYSAGSPLSACGGHHRGHHSHSSLPQALSGTTVTPVSSPHGSAASTANTRRTPQGVAGVPMHARATGSRDGSRGSSPWHLSEMSEMSRMSTASDRMNSNPSGSDSCGEMASGQAWGVNLRRRGDDDTGSEDVSQSDTPNWPRSTQLSDSDCMTPQSHDAGGNSARGDSARGSSGAEEDNRTKDTQEILWQNIKSEITRGVNSIDRLPRRLENTLSPGNTGAMGNFRNAVGMNESGPVMTKRAPPTGGEDASGNVSSGFDPGPVVFNHGTFNPAGRPINRDPRRRTNSRNNAPTV